MPKGLRAIAHWRFLRREVFSHPARRVGPSRRRSNGRPAGVQPTPPRSEVRGQCPGQHDDDRGAMQRQPEHRSPDIEGHPGSISSTRTASTVHLPNLSRLAITLGGETTDHQTLAWRFTNGPVWLKLGGCIRQPTEFPSQVRAIRIRCRFINTIALVNGCEPNDKGHPGFINRRSQIQQRVGSLTRKTRIRAGVRESQSI